MKKRILALLLAMTTMGASLAGCGGPTDQNSAASDGAGAEPGEKVVLTYANWLLRDTDQVQMNLVKEFNRQNEGRIEVVPVDKVDYDKYIESLTTLASSGELPDLFMLPNLPDPLSNDWLQDITTFAEADDEWETIIPVLRERASVNDKVVAIPAGAHFYGLLVNDDAFEKVNVPTLPNNPSLEQFESTLKAVNQPDKGVVALKMESDFVNVLPSVTNPDLDYFAFDDANSKYILDGNDFQNAIKKTAEWRKNGYSWPGLSEAQTKNFSGTSDWEAWEKGEAAINFDGTWGFGAIGKTLNFDLSFKGMIDGKTILVPDYHGISATCEHPAEAFEFAKFMGYAKDTYDTKIKLATEAELAYFGMPITTDAEVQQKILDFIQVDGLKETFDTIDQAMVEPVKLRPGYIASRWEGETGIKIGDKENATIGDIIMMAIEGKINYADYATQVSDLATQKYEEASAQIK